MKIPLRTTYFIFLGTAKIWMLRIQSKCIKDIWNNKNCKYHHENKSTHRLSFEEKIIAAKLIISYVKDGLVHILKYIVLFYLKFWIFWWLLTISFVNNIRRQKILWLLKKLNFKILFKKVVQSKIVINRNIIGIVSIIFHVNKQKCITINNDSAFKKYLCK